MRRYGIKFTPSNVRNLFSFLAQLKFEATNERGQYYEMVFLKDEAGKIAKCKVTTMGFEVEGTRIK